MRGAAGRACVGGRTYSCRNNVGGLISNGADEGMEKIESGIEL